MQLRLLKAKERYVIKQTLTIRGNNCIIQLDRRIHNKKYNYTTDELWNLFKSKINVLRREFPPKELLRMKSWKIKGSSVINQVSQDATKISHTGEHTLDIETKLKQRSFVSEME